MAKRYDGETRPQAEQPMDLQPVQTERRARQGIAPYCPYHKESRCESRRSEALFTRYYCPVDGCGFAVKVPRPNIAQRMARMEEDGDFSAR